MGAPDTRLEIRAQRVERRSRLIAGLVLTSVVGIVAVATMRIGTDVHHAMEWFVLAMLLAVGPIPPLLLVGLDRKRVVGTLRIGEQSLVWEGSPLFSRGAIRDAIAYTNGDRHGVRVKAGRRTAYFELAGADEADRVVAALGKDSGQAAVSFASGFGGLFATLSYVQFFGDSHRAAVISFVVFLTVVPIAIELLTRQRWLVGADGLLIHPGVGRKRFVPYTDFTGMKVEGATIKVDLRDGKTLHMKSVDDKKRTERPVVGVNALARRMAQARAHAASRRSAEDVSHVLARGDRTIDAWVRELEELETRPATYRVAGIRRESLWRTLEDTTQRAQLRAAALIALRRSLDENERARLRVMANACASPRLRVALETAQASDESRFTEALAYLEEAEREPAAREANPAFTGRRGT